MPVAVAIDSKSRVVVASQGQTAGWELYRQNANFTPDATWGPNGWYRLPKLNDVVGANGASVIY